MDEPENETLNEMFDRLNLLYHIEKHTSSTGLVHHECTCPHFAQHRACKHAIKLHAAKSIEQTPERHEFAKIERIKRRGRVKVKRNAVAV